MNFLSSLEKQSKPFWIVAGFALIGGVGILDFLTGYELAFSLFYLIPVALIAWLTSRRLGIVVCSGTVFVLYAMILKDVLPAALGHILVASFLSLVSAIVWFIADIAAGSLYSHPFIYVWNTLIHLSFFVITALLLSTLRKVLEREREIAHIDYLTGAINSRLFYDFAQMEIDRIQRYEHPFTLAYIDLDNFKVVNDSFGHSVGDQALRTVVSATKKYLRKTDVVARLGGDEFVLLLPETNQESARVVLSKIQSGLLEEMRQNNWPITFSIGVLTCSAAPHTTDELVRMADELMYSVKHNGKNGIKYSVYAG